MRAETAHHAWGTHFSTASAASQASGLNINMRQTGASVWQVGRAVAHGRAYRCRWGRAAKGPWAPLLE